jgi:hypothetical protein
MKKLLIFMLVLILATQFLVLNANASERSSGRWEGAAIAIGSLLFLQNFVRPMMQPPPVYHREYHHYRPMVVWEPSYRVEIREYRRNWDRPWVDRGWYSWNHLRLCYFMERRIIIREFGQRWGHRSRFYSDP